MIFRHCKKKEKSIHDSAMEITANTPRHHCHPQIKKRRSCLWTWSRKCFTIWKWAVYAPIHMAWCSGKALHISAETAYLQSRPFTYWKHSVHPKMKKQTNKTKQKKDYKQYSSPEFQQLAFSVSRHLLIIVRDEGMLHSDTFSIFCCR